MILDRTRDWPFLVIHRVTKIHMIYPFIARRIFEVAILQAHKIVHPYLLLSSFLVSSSLSRLEDLCEVLGKWQAKACILFRGEKKKNAKENVTSTWVWYVKILKFAISIWFYFCRKKRFISFRNFIAIPPSSF